MDTSISVTLTILGEMDTLVLVTITNLEEMDTPVSVGELNHRALWSLSKLD